MPFLSFGMCWDFQLCQTQTPYAKTLRSWGYNFAAGSSCKTLQASLTSTLAFWVGKPVPRFVQAPQAENQPKLIPSEATARKPVQPQTKLCSQLVKSLLTGPHKHQCQPQGPVSWPPRGSASPLWGQRGAAGDLRPPSHHRATPVWNWSDTGLRPALAALVPDWNSYRA